MDRPAAGGTAAVVAGHTPGFSFWGGCPDRSSADVGRPATTMVGNDLLSLFCKNLLRNDSHAVSREVLVLGDKNLKRIKIVSRCTGLLRRAWNFPPPGIYHKEYERDFGPRLGFRLFLTSVVGMPLCVLLWKVLGLISWVSANTRFWVCVLALLFWCGFYFVYWVWKNEPQNGGDV